MTAKIRRGLEQNRKNITPEIGELLYTTDEKKIFIGDGETPGGISLIPVVKEWELKSVISQTEYSFPTESPLSPNNNGVYLVFYSSVKLSKNDYQINNLENSITLDFTPTENDIEISVIYMGY